MSVHRLRSTVVELVIHIWSSVDQLHASHRCFLIAPLINEQNTFDLLCM